MRFDRPTILDLARLTGVSPSTVSRAYNPDPDIRINPATRHLILRTAKEIGYSPYPAARTMIYGRSGRWGLLLPHLRNPLYTELVSHLDMQAHRRSTQLLIGLAQDSALEAGLVLHWASGEVDGIIADSGVQDEAFEMLRKRRFPIVFLFGPPSPDSPDFDYVHVDTNSGYAQLMEKMMAAGHRKIGFVGQEFDSCRVHGSFRAYSAAFKTRGWKLDESLIYFGSRDYLAGAQAWGHWRTQARRPTAVLCFNDIIACNLIQSAENDGCRVPENLSVTGCDDINVAEHYRLTTIKTDPALMAEQIFKLLERKRTGKSQLAVIPSTVVERGSIGPRSPSL